MTTRTSKRRAERPFPVKSYIRRYSDTGQTVAYVEWSDGSRTEGSHKNEHMRALMDRADTLGCPFEHQVW